MKPISRENFNAIFPILQEIYNDSNHNIKMWEGTVRKRFVIDNWEYEVKRYWEEHGIKK